MQGACSGAVPADFGSQASSGSSNSNGTTVGAFDTPSTPPLATPTGSQCVLLSDDRVFQFQGLSDPVWVDSLLVRHVWAAKEYGPDEARTFVNMMGADTSEVWFTNITMQGDQQSEARSRAMDPWQLASLYYRGV